MHVNKHCTNTGAINNDILTDPEDWGLWTLSWTSERNMRGFF